MQAQGPLLALEAGSGRGKRRGSEDSVVEEEEIKKRALYPKVVMHILVALYNIDIPNVLYERSKAGRSIHTIDWTDGENT